MLLAACSSEKRGGCQSKPDISFSIIALFCSVIYILQVVTVEGVIWDIHY